MPTATINFDAVQLIDNWATLVEFLTNELDWPLDVEATLEEQAFQWSPRDLRLTPEEATRLRGGEVHELRFLDASPWGVFVVRFAQNRVSVKALRQVLRGLVESKSKDPALTSWRQEDLLFICATQDYEEFVFAHFRKQDQRPAVLATFSWEKGSAHLHTLCEFNLAKLVYPDDPADHEVWRAQWRTAFDVEAVTQKFFEEYGGIFKQVERQVRGVPGDKENPDARRLYVQRLFNRLMFLYFVQKKGWLEFEGDKNYLRALYEAPLGEGQDFLKDRLHWAFFAGLNYPGDQPASDDDENLRRLRGNVPFLNGGLFDLEADGSDERGQVTIPHGTFDAILTLFERYNFTVEESTPLDVQVAVDPEMLGKVFEELVTGRHETGSYYTPRPVVAFMCREALKGYLSAYDSREAIARFVDGDDASQLKNPEALLDALRRVRVCDPACGSGAYLLGMMQELMRLRHALLRDHRIDAETTYRKKLEIIQRNLYGADIDRFAANIAMLRLWLTLVIEYDGPKPPPLPNLNYKIACGDSLTGPNPLARTLQSDAYDKHAARLARLHDEIFLLGVHRREGRKTRPIHEIQREINDLQKEISGLFGNMVPEGALDWRAHFAEVFAQRQLPVTIGRRLNLGQELAEQPEPGGFDIVLANPPYVRADAQFKHIENEKKRQVAIAEYKGYRARLLKSGLYETLFEKWDLFMPFLERAHQMLCPGGQMVFIISDAYNAAKYTQKSHAFFLKNARVQRLDFCSEIKLFRAGVQNTIVHFAKGLPGADHVPFRVRRWGEREQDFEKSMEVLDSLPQTEFGEAVFRFNETKEKDENGFVQLSKICYVSVGMVIHADERRSHGAFKAEDLISNKRDKKHPRAYVEGKDLLPWATRRIRYLEYGTSRAPGLFRRPTFPELHEAKEKLLALRIAGKRLAVAYDDHQLLCNHTAVIFVPWHLLKGVVNNSINKSAKYKRQAADGDREEREKLSKQFHVKYVLAVMNSTFARTWLLSKRRGKLDIYPDDWKPLPIAPLSLEEQRPFVELVDKILKEYRTHGHPLPAEAATRVAQWEKELDEKVAALYHQVGRG